MNCVSCEVGRARLKAARLLSSGKTVYEAAAELSKQYGERYYVEDAVLYRASKIGDFKPYIIFGVWPYV